MMYKYQPGDKVVLRLDLNKHDTYCMENDPAEYNSVTDEMMQHAGSTVTIRSIEYGQYTIEEMFGVLWTDEMFVGFDTFGAEDDTDDDFCESDESIYTLLGM